MAKRTPFFDAHVKYGGKIVEFAGYELPIQYDGFGLIAEHHAVRQRAGLFDVSHMGEFIISGAGAEVFVDYILSGDIKGLNDGQIRYTLMPNERGGAVDDVLVYKFSAQKYMLVVNASNCQKDEEWIKKHLPQSVKFENISDGIAQLALQGPLARDIILKLSRDGDLPQKYYWFKDGVTVGGVKCLVSRTGYTGEFGYELYFAPQHALELYDKIMKTGKEFSLAPAGLGCRDTLRFEAGMPLYGHELAEDYMLNEVDLNFTIKMQKGEFIGRSALEKHEPQYCRTGVKVIKGIAREHDKVFCGDAEAGVVTSGTHSPTLGFAVAALRLKKEYSGQPLTAEVRGRRLELEPLPMPFYKR